MLEKIEKSNGKIIKSILICLLLLVAASGIGYWFKSYNLLDTNIVMIYMVCVLISASLTEGFVYGIVQAFLSIEAFNYFFVEPYYSLNVDNPSYATAMIIMLFAAVITSMITSRSKINEKNAREREEETTLLLRLNNHIAEACSLEDIAYNVVKYASNILKCKIACTITGEDGKLIDRYLRQAEDGEQVWERISSTEELERAFCCETRTECYDSEEYRDWPIYGKSGLLGTLRIPLMEAKRMGQTQIRLFMSIKETAHLAMDRLCVLRQQMLDNMMMEKERYRSMLLRSISHDLRTPLAGIMGATEMLLHMTDEQDLRRKTLEGISREAQWLYELVENVLTLTRLRDGKLIHKQPEACEEVIETSVRRIRGRAGSRSIKVQVPEECIEVPMDARLIEQVLVNIMDNAVKYTGETGEICIRVRKEKEEAVFEVMDNGRGIQEKELPFLFQQFYTTHGENTDKVKGIGMGLTICESIVDAHGGKIHAANREDTRGAVFRFTIPMKQGHLNKGWDGYAE